MPVSVQSDYDYRPDAPPANVVAKTDALRMVSTTIAAQITRMMNAGMSPNDFAVMFVEHLAGIIAMVEPPAARRRAVEKTVSLLKKEVLKAAHQRQEQVNRV